MLNSLRFRLTVIFISLAVGPLIFVGAIIGLRGYASLEQQGLALQREIAASVGSEIRAFIEGRENELILLDEVYGLGIREPKDQRAILSSMLLYQHAYQEVVLLNFEGQEQIRLSRTSVILDDDLQSRAGNEEFLYPATRGETYFSPVRFDETIREPLVTISVPLFDQRSGEVVSVLAADLRFKKVWELLAAIELPNGGSAYVVDRAGQVVAHRNPAVVLRGATIDLPATDGRAEGLSGTDVIVARDILQFGNQELIVLAEQPVSTALELATNSIRIAVAATSGAFVLAVIFVVLTTRQIVRPIEALATSAQAISGGDFSQQVEISPPDDEIADLARTFNFMARALQEREEALRRRAEELDVLQATVLDITTPHDLPTLLQTIVERAALLLNAPGGGLYLCDPDQEETRCVVSYNTPRDYTGTVLKYGEGAAGIVAQTGEPLIIDDYHTWSGRAAAYEEEQQPFTAVLSAPMIWQDQVTGVIHVLHDVETRRFTQADLELLTLFANHAAIAVENTRLYEAAQQELTERKRAEEDLRQRQLQLSGLNRMGRALAGTFELVRIYRIAYEHVAQLVDCPCFGISLYDPPTRTLRAEFMLDDGELIDAARFPPMVMDAKPTQGRVRAIATRQPEIITNYPAVLEKATGDVMVRVGVSEDEHDTGAAMYVPMVARGQVIGLLEVQSYRLDAYGAEHAALLGPVANQIGLSIQNAQLYEEAQRELTERKRAEGELQRTLEKLREALGGIIQTVALTVETRDPYTAGHQRRVSSLARAIANEMGLSEEQIDGIRMAGLIHDLGKINIPAEILSKPIGLNDLEYGLIQAHPQTGYDILKEIEFPWPMAQIVLQHHERLDGSGYPQGLSGEEILLEARILAVADVVEAMASFRPYRPARGLDKALEEISQNRGVLYDPGAVDACLKLLAEERFTFE